MKLVKLFNNKSTWLIVGMIIACTSQCFALPWDNAIDTIKDAITGKIAMAGVTIAICGAGATLAFGEMGGFAKRAIQIVFGAAICLGCAQIVALFN